MTKPSGRRRARQIVRAAERQVANAALCKVPITEWRAMTRDERKRRLIWARVNQRMDEFYFGTFGGGR